MTDLVDDAFRGALRAATALETGPAAAPAAGAAVRAATPADPGPVHVLVNRGSGGQDQDRLDRVRAAMRAALGHDGAVVAEVSPRRIAEAARNAARAGAGTVVACGGDGTIAGVSEGLKDEAAQEGGARLGVLPAGTFNYFARGLGIPLDLEGAARAIAAGATRALTVGEVNGRLFLNNASLGVYPAILREREDVYRRYGRSRVAAYWSVLRTMQNFRRPLRLRIEHDQGEISVRTPLAFVGSSAYQLDRLGIDGAGAVRDGKLALLIAPDEDGGALIRRAMRLGARMAVKGEDYRLIVSSRLRIETGSGTRLLARDGERERMRGPFEIAARPGALRVAVPKEAG